MNKGKLLLSKKKGKVVKTPSRTFRLECVLYINSFWYTLQNRSFIFTGSSFQLRKMLLWLQCCLEKLPN